MKTCYLLMLLLLLITLHNSIQQDLVFTYPPQNETVCVRDEVNITCGYAYSFRLPPVWEINNQTFSHSSLNQTIYGLPITSNTNNTVLTVYSVHERMNQTTFQCVFQIPSGIQSSVGTLTVMGPPTPAVIKVVERRLTSLVISWDTFSHTSCGDVTYNVTLSDGIAELVEEITTTNNTISFTDLVDDTQYEVTVLAINNAGPGTVVTDYVSTLTPSVSSPPTDLVIKLIFIDYRPVITLTWNINVSSLAYHIPEVEAFKISLTGKDSNITTTVHVPSNTISYTSDDNISRHLDVGANHTISVCSLNSAGCSETVNASVAIQWLISASAQLHSNNQYINVSCNTTLSAPEAKCLATLNCTNCDEVTTKVFTGHTLLSVIAGSDYHISVQAIRSDNIVPLEEYSIVETLSVPQPSPEPTVAQQPLVTDQLQSAKLPQSTEHLQLTGKPRSTVMPQPTKYPASESKDDDNIASIAGIVTGTIMITIGVVVLISGAVLFYQCTKCTDCRGVKQKDKKELNTLQSVSCDDVSPAYGSLHNNVKMQSCPAYEIAHHDVKMQSCPAYEIVHHDVKMQSCPAYDTIKNYGAQVNM